MGHLHGPSSKSTAPTRCVPPPLRLCKASTRWRHSSPLPPDVVERHRRKPAGTRIALGQPQMSRVDGGQSGGTAPGSMTATCPWCLPHQSCVASVSVSNDDAAHESRAAARFANADNSPDTSAPDDDVARPPARA